MPAVERNCIGQMLCQFKQVDCIRHRLDPRRFLHHGIFGLAAVIKIGEDTPLFNRMKLLNKQRFNLPCCFQQNVAASCRVSKNDLEKDGGSTGPIFAEFIAKANDIRPEYLLDSVDGFIELCCANALATYIIYRRAIMSTAASGSRPDSTIVRQRLIGIVAVLCEDIPPIVAITGALPSLTLAGILTFN